MQSTLSKDYCMFGFCCWMTNFSTVWTAKRVVIFKRFVSAFDSLLNLTWWMLVWFIFTWSILDVQVVNLSRWSIAIISILSHLIRNLKRGRGRCLLKRGNRWSRRERRRGRAQGRAWPMTRPSTQWLPGWWKKVRKCKQEQDIKY